MADLSGAQDFLSKVEEIESLIKGLANSDESQIQEANQKADAYLQKLNEIETQVALANKNVINNKPSAVSGNDGPPAEGNDKEAFMAMMERDAQERYARKKQAEKEAMVHKERGNEEFKKGNYEKAVECYSEALHIFKDTTVLWTNRAQAYNKLGEYEKALSDCDWATRVFENCLKAYIHAGKAHLGLKQFDQATESYEKAITIEPKKRAMIENYIKEVELARQTHEQERAAQEKQSFGDTTAQGIAGILEQLNKQGQLSMYYSGGLRILTDHMRSTEESKTMFRMNGGLKLIESHFLISKCFNVSPRSLGRDEIDMCEAALTTMKCACAGNEENQLQFLDLTDILLKLSRFLDTKMKSARQLKREIAELLLTITENELSRRKLVSSSNVDNLIESLLLQLNSKNTHTTVASIINNLALTTKFKAMMREKFDEMIPQFEQVMIKETGSEKILPQCISTLTNLCAEKQLQAMFMKRKELWDACTLILERNASQAVLFSVLGLLVNLCHSPSEQLNEHSHALIKHCVALLGSTDVDLRMRSLTLTSALLQHSKHAEEFTANESVLEHCVYSLQDADVNMRKLCVKCLALCTQNNEEAKRHVIQDKTAVKNLLEQLNHSDAAMVGNSALCLGHCIESSPALSATVADSTIIMDLLVLARDAHKPTAQHNCAILIAKLCKTDVRHLERLRELHGLEILHDVLKIVKE